MKWVCNNCEEIHNRNPEKCGECGHTILTQFSESQLDGGSNITYTPAIEGVEGGGWGGLILLVLILLLLAAVATGVWMLVG